MASSGCTRCTHRDSTRSVSGSLPTRGCGGGGSTRWNAISTARRSSMHDDDGILLSDDEGRSVLRFERRLSHSPERVWRALTERPELTRWHPTPFSFEPSVGGEVTFHPEPGAPPMPAGEVLE